MSTTAYSRQGGDHSNHALVQERSAMKMVATLLGLNIETFVEEVPGTDIAIKQLLSTSGPGTTIVIATPSALSAKPNFMIDLASQFLAKGVRLVVADQPSHRFDIEGLRANLAPLNALQAKVEELEARLQEQEIEHNKEFSDYQAVLEKTLMDGLAARGVSLSHLLRPTSQIDTASVAPRPDQGRELKKWRDELGYSQDFAGQLVSPPLPKSAISKLEANGSSEPRYGEYQAELQVAYILKQTERKKLAQGINPRPDVGAQARSKALQKRMVEGSSPAVQQEGIIGEAASAALLHNVAS